MAIKTPGFLADQVMKTAYRVNLVTRRDLSDGLFELVLAGEDFGDLSLIPGESTAFRTSRTEFRHYTPARLDAQTGELSIVVQRHGTGPGEALVLGWSDGDDLLLCRFGSKKNFRWEDDDSPILVIGDGTVVSLAMSFGDRALAESRPFRAVLEVAEADVAAVQKLVPGAEVIAAAGAPGEATDAWLQANASGIDPATTVYLAGHGQSIQRQRNLLKDLTDLDRKAIKTQPYWADGKTGL